MKTKRKSCITHENLYRLLKWVESNIELIDGKSDAAVARMAVADLGFDVSPSTITGIRTSDKNPLNWNPAVVRKPAPIADTVDSVSGDIKTLLKMVMTLMHENYQRGVDLGIPPEFGELHQRVVG